MPCVLIRLLLAASVLAPWSGCRSVANVTLGTGVTLDAPSEFPFRTTLASHVRRSENRLGLLATIPERDTGGSEETVVEYDLVGRTVDVVGDAGASLPARIEFEFDYSASVAASADRRSAAEAVFDVSAAVVKAAPGSRPAVTLVAARNPAPVIASPASVGETPLGIRVAGGEDDAISRVESGLVLVLTDADAVLEAGQTYRVAMQARATARLRGRGSARVHGRVTLRAIRIRFPDR